MSRVRKCIRYILLWLLYLGKSFVLQKAKKRSLHPSLSWLVPLVLMKTGTLFTFDTLTVIFNQSIRTNTSWKAVSGTVSIQNNVLRQLRATSFRAKRATVRKLKSSRTIYRTKASTSPLAQWSPICSRIKLPGKIMKTIPDFFGTNLGIYGKCIANWIFFSVFGHTFRSNTGFKPWSWVVSRMTIAKLQLILRSMI